ncbi:MAG TPA: Flp family type IVb pilin [Phycisphaerae bacterium]|nr:Flp family type IVb pilin [Phycisphaerales bacterium]HRX87415.1 Flp family type IVb pilin [Phycisphaerae bacterium]
MKNWRAFLREEDGPTATEYAVMLSIIIMAVVATVKLLGGHVRDNMKQSADTIGSVV